MSMEELRSKLPGRDELLERLPTHSSPRRASEQLLTSIGLFGAGIVVGAGLALLFAPKPGRELRRDLGEKVEHARSSGNGQTGEAARAAGA